MTDSGSGYPSFEPPTLIATDVFEFSADPSVINLSEETLKALSMPSKRSQAILLHLERQASAMQDMQTKIKDQIRRLQVEESFLKKKLLAAPLEEDDIEAPAPPSNSMNVDVIPVRTPVQAVKISKPKPTKSVLPPPDLSDEEEDEEDELPPSLRMHKSPFGNNMVDDEDFDDDDDDDTMSRVRRILQEHR